MRSGQVKVDAVEADALPAELRKLSQAELQKHVDEAWTRRSQIQGQIAELGTQRQAYVESEMKKTGLDASKSFDVVLRGAIRSQARASGLEFPAEKAPVAPTPVAKVDDGC
jgi:hypothetical protein